MKIITNIRKQVKSITSQRLQYVLTITVNDLKCFASVLSEQASLYLSLLLTNIVLLLLVPNKNEIKKPPDTPDEPDQVK